MRATLIHRTLFLAVLAVVLVAFAFSTFNSTARIPPSGYVLLPATATSPASYQFCDFAVHFNFLRQIWHHEVERPYTAEGQVQLMKNWLPHAPSGMPHAYSPVALVLMLPLFDLDTGTALAVFRILDLILLVVLIFAYLQPRATNTAQAFAVLAAFGGLSFLVTLSIGQTSVFTTCLLALGWVLLQRQDELKWMRSPAGPLSLALILWLLAFKPSFAMIWVTVLLGAQSWRALAWAAVSLLFTWLALGPNYGGWVTGLQDYAWLIGHYYQEALPSFLHPGCTPEMNTNFNSFLLMVDPALGASSFKLNQFIFQAGNIAAIILCWKKRLTLSQLFQAALWNYLLFCPQLCATEDWVICLLVVEGNFFRPGFAGVIKILLIWAIVNLRWGFLTDYPLFFPFKLVLFLWWLWETVRPISPASSESEGPQVTGSLPSRLSS